jgi:hypothetical protein
MTPIESIVSDWPGTEVKPHDRGGREFTLNGREIGHIHQSQLVDIPFAKRVRDILLEERRAQKHHVFPNSGWVSYQIESDQDVDGALWLLRVAYLYHLITVRKRDGDHTELNAVDVETALAELDTSDELKQVFSDLRGAEPN